METPKGCRCSICNPNQNEGCTCWYGAYSKYAGGTGWDIVKYDPECPVHLSEDDTECDCECCVGNCYPPEKEVVDASI